jgi:hypothetical protein
MLEAVAQLADESLLNVCLVLCFVIQDFHGLHLRSHVFLEVRHLECIVKLLLHLRV